MTVRPRVDGTHRVLFEVPPKLRPSDWCPTYVLPLLPPRRGNLDDLEEVARIKRDAAKLYADLKNARDGVARLGGSPPPLVRSVRTLCEHWRSSQRYKALSPRTRMGYADMAQKVLDWSEQKRHPDPTHMKRASVEQFLSRYDDRPTTRYHLRAVMRLIMDQAVALGWRPDNPLDGVRVAVPKSRVVVWEQADVERLAWAAAVGGQRDVAVMILIQWEIGQRMTDMVLMRRAFRPEQEGYDAAAGEFRFHQSKTGAFVCIPVSDRAHALLTAIEREPETGDEGPQPFLFHDGGTGRAFRSVERLGHVFDDVRKGAGGRHLLLRTLRHSCVVQLARAGCTTPEMAAITGHQLTSVEAILSKYLPRDNQVARRAQEKRGLIRSADRNPEPVS